MKHAINHLSKEKIKFQLDRLILFSDAVFAIAITLMVIDLKVPELTENPTDENLFHALLALTPKFIGFLVSFFLIGLYWTIHHRLFGYVIHYTTRLLWLNLFFLLGIVVLPFTTNFYSTYIISGLKTPLIAYSFNFAYVGMTSYIMHKYVTNPKRNLTEGISSADANYYSFRAILIPIIFALITFVTFFNVWYAMYIPPLIPLIMYLMGKIYKAGKKHKRKYA